MKTEDYDEICYKKNFLTKVIARVDLLSPIKEIKSELPVSISKIAKIYFPIAEPKKVIVEEKKITKNGIEKTSISESKEWHFHDKNRKKSLVILPTSIFVNLSTYSSYEKLKEEFQKIVVTFFESFNEAQVSRLGLRYINEIMFEEKDPLAWNSYINKNILCLLKFCRDKKSLSRVFSTVEFNYGDYNLRYQFGIFNPDFPAPIKKKNFILDYDAFYEGLQDQNEVIPNLARYHHKIQEIFEQSITDNMREKLNEG